jgi:adenine-specific DNA-methyltransferase
MWFADDVGDNASAKKALLRRFPRITAFDTPKPESLLERIIGIATEEGDIVLDCYLGSGTTAVVAQRLRRRWIGIERNELTVQGFVLPRLREGVQTDRRYGFTVATVEEIPK